MISVYWLYDALCSTPDQDGYVGITNNVKRRVRNHRTHGRFPPGFKVRILFEGTQSECAVREAGYRPHPSMGWNVRAGGGLNARQAEATKQKLRALKLGRPNPGASAGNSKRFSNNPIHRNTLLRRNAGNTYAVGFKNALGYHHTTETKRRVGDAVRKAFTADKRRVHSITLLEAYRSGKHARLTEEQKRFLGACVSEAARLRRSDGPEDRNATNNRRRREKYARPKAEEL